MKIMISLILLFFTGLQAQVIFTDQADSLDRRLMATYNDPITMGNNCKKLCRQRQELLRQQRFYWGLLL
jgi:hypothetical protein